MAGVYGVGGFDGDLGGVAVAPMSPAGAGRAGRLSLLAAFAAVYLVWGSTYLAIAVAVETIPPFLMIGARCLLAGAVLYGWTRLRHGTRPTGADWRAALVAGSLLFVSGQAVLAWSETRIPSGAAALLVATEPLFIVLLGWRGGRLLTAGHRGERPRARAWLAIAAGFLGVALVVRPGGGGLDLLGAGAALLASLSWSLGLFRARARAGLPATQFAGMQLLTSGAVLVAAWLVAGDPAALATSRLSPRSLLAFGYLVGLGSVVTYTAYVWLLGQVGPARLSTHAYVNPLVAVALGAAFAGEALTPWLVAATGLILGAVAVLVRREAPAAAESSKATAAGGPRVPKPPAGRPFWRLRGPVGRGRAAA